MFLPFIGLEVGILLMFYEYIFTNLHFYSQDIHVPIWTYIMQLFMTNSSYHFSNYYKFNNHSKIYKYIHLCFYFL
jgi:hypothetical protein